jgi:alkylhydroperoxidase family enzyme
LLGDAGAVDAVLKDYRTAPISDGDKALFRFVEKVNSQSNQIRLEDVEEVRQAGWSDEALYDATTVCALFNFYNRWVDATGVHDLPAAAYAMQAQRLKGGYIHAATAPKAVASG